MRQILAPLPWLGLLALLLVAPATADEARDAYEARFQPGRCLCHQGKATWEYLRSPLARPGDDPRCGLLLKGGDCGNRPRPPGTRAACWGSTKEACFWRRHASSWQIRCSECWKEGVCEPCGELLGGPDPMYLPVLKERVESERRSMDDPVVVTISPHFYVVTNLQKSVKLVTYRGTKRLMTAHEVAHLYAQRAEQAYDDFVYWYGPPIVLPKPMSIYVVDRQKEAWRIGARYFGAKETKMNYAFNYGDRIAEGFSGNGCVVNHEDQHDEQHMHGFVRHMIGHILFSCWHLTNGFEDRCPRWAWVGAAHFLTKLLDVHQDFATLCQGETAGGDGPRKKWKKRVRDMAKKPMTPIETFFARSSLSSLDYQDHLRAWSIMDFMLREDRERWLALLLDLRNGGQEAAAFQKHLGLTPEMFHERWVERVLGRRKTMGEEKGDEVLTGEADRRQLEALRRTTDPETLAGKIRGLDLIHDRKLAEVVVGHLDSDTDLVRETIVLSLARTTDTAVLEYLREEAFASTDPLIRAALLRVLGKMKDVVAVPTYVTLLEDRHWLVRANAAWALEQAADPSGLPALEKALDDEREEDKTWIALADAYTALATSRSKAATIALTRRVRDRLWQVRLVAVRALRKVGTEHCLNALIEQFAREGGRLKREFHATLKVIARDDLGPNPHTWQNWWRKQQEEFGGLPPDLPEVAPNPADERYGKPKDDLTEDGDPTYYGKRFFSHTVCFVMDKSKSMKYAMDVEPSAAKQLGDIPLSGTRIEIARRALADSFKRLDPRTLIKLVFFDTKVKHYKRGLWPASPANVNAAIQAMNKIQPSGETNFHDAIRAAMGLKRGASLAPDLDPIPDTVFFLTDGRPTRGEMQSMPELVSWMRNLNRFAKLEMHVIALGDLNVDTEWLGHLADAGSGELIWVPEKR